jgi:aspartate racemase
MDDGRILGVLGGMGPLAGAIFMDRLTRLTPAAREQDQVALATAGIPPGATLGLMGTAATLEANLYQSRLATRGHNCLVPDAPEMELLLKPGIRLVKENRVAEAAPPLIEAAQTLVRRGAAAIVLGCTEIPIALRDVPSADLGAPAIDTMDALALVAIRWARGAD